MIPVLEQAFALPAGTVIQIPGEEAQLWWIIFSLLFLPAVALIFLDCVIGWVRLLDLAFFYSRESRIFAAFVVFVLFHILCHNGALRLRTFEMSLVLVFDVFDFFDIFDM
ncbi:hypothetical protein BJX68DRAFT_266683 [Aspergillus pseudodeflectus]|uniref:Uncharacterized protein n=1 Tax=Aspergillus pseudodeflectus TaxID=176178 RepID=A0ABR4KDW6_9EURO